jgi:hypothetical protein
MVIILFSAFGSDFSPSEFVLKHGIKNASIWSKGHQRRSGNVNEDSGFSISFEEAKTTSQSIEIMTLFLKTEEDWIDSLQELDVNLQLHLGVFVGSNQSFAPCFEFDIPFLTLLAEHKINLHISAYPTSDI